MLRDEKTKNAQGECGQARLGQPRRSHSCTKVFALALSVIMLALAFTPFDPKVVGLYSHAPITPHDLITLRPQNLTYHFFHANIIHWLINAWCFLSCVFLADVSFRKLCLAYLIACSAPALSATPTIGFSGVCFALLGVVMWQSANKRYYNMIIGVSVLLTVVLCPKAVNNFLHLYCYILGAVSVPVFSKLRRKLAHNP